MSTVNLIPMGVGEAFTARYYTSCLALGFLDQWLMIDCPHPARKMLREGSLAAGLAKPLDFDRIHAAAISHLHADHCCGLEAFGYY
jgi:glyoxylase-like metal-dependent hydrolase (beta-lactamase superfamily II)